MAFEPDIVGLDTETQEIMLVAEVRMAIRNLAAAERQLKTYMAAMRCPVGLLITPQRLWIYRDRYLGPGDDSIVRAGDFDVSGVFRFGAVKYKTSLEFEAAVQSWFEGLATEAGLRRLPPELRRAAELYLAPAVFQGTIRAAHPRVA